MKPNFSDALHKLQQQFADQLPQKLKAIRESFEQLKLSSWQLQEAERLRQLLHNLGGSADTFGMTSVSNAANAMDFHLTTMLKTASIPTRSEWQHWESELNRMDKLARIQLSSEAPILNAPNFISRLNHSPLIYLIDDDPNQAEHLSHALQEDGYKTQIFTSASAFRSSCIHADAERPDAIIMDMIFPEGDNTGAILLKEIKATHTNCPPVIFASVRGDIESRLAALRAGASRYLVKPVDNAHLISLLDILTGRQPHQPYKVLMVDDDPLVLEAQATVLRGAGMDVLTLNEPLKILDILRKFTPDIVVLDVYMPDASGPEIAAILRERDAQLHIPILFLSAETDMSQQLLALKLGGDDFLVKPALPAHLIDAVTVRARHARQNSTVRDHLASNMYERQREHLALNQHAIVSITDNTGKIIEVNDKFCEISGYEQYEVVGYKNNKVKSNKHSLAFYQNLWQTISSGNVWHGELCNLKKDGSNYWMESTITPFLDNKGVPYQYVMISTDITVLKSAERRLNSAQNIAHMGSYEWNISTGKLQWSDEHFRLWGLKPQSITPNLELFRQYIHPDDLAKVNYTLEQALQNNGDFNVEHRVIWPDGSHHHIHGQGKVTFNDAGQAILIQGTVQDITHIKKAEETLTAAYEAAERSNNAKSQFLTSMSHELRTPLNAILGFSQLLGLDAKKLTPDQQESIAHILTAGHQLLGLVNEVLDLSRIDTGNMQFNIQTVNIADIISSCISQVDLAMAKQNNISIQNHISDSYLSLRGDDLRLRQVMINLLSNAVKYNKPNGRITVSKKLVPNNKLRIEVSDTGNGIAQDKLALLFTPFERIDQKHGTISGVGIGLHITKQLIEAMQGTVGVESKVGQGSTFWFELPLAS